MSLVIGMALVACLCYLLAGTRHRGATSQVIDHEAMYKLNFKSPRFGYLLGIRSGPRPEDAQLGLGREKASTRVTPQLKAVKGNTIPERSTAMVFPQHKDDHYGTSKAVKEPEDIDIHAAARAIPRLEAVKTAQSNSVAKPKFGYVLALHYSDQMTGSASNVLSMQCWAYSLGSDVRVVEPFLRRSVLGVDDQHRIQMESTVKSGGMKSVKLSDAYDRVVWDEFTSSGFAPLTSWDYFIENAQRKMIVVERQCVGRDKCMECGDVRSKDLQRSIQVLTERYGFEVVRKVCYPRNLMLESEFKQLVYEKYAPHEVVVVFNCWGGIDVTDSTDFVWRIGISNNMDQCRRGPFVRTFPNSDHLKDDATQYTQKCLSKSGYISVMVRLEHFYLAHNRFEGNSNIEILYVLEELYKDIVTKVDMFKAMHGVDGVFLAMDCGKHGSTAFTSNHISPDDYQLDMMNLLSDSAKTLYRMLYGNSSTLEEWEESFYSVSSFRNEGYIAMLQKQLAAMGTCLITVGGGAFQDTARNLYSAYADPSRFCVAII